MKRSIEIIKTVFGRHVKAVETEQGLGVLAEVFVQKSCSSKSNVSLEEGMSNKQMAILVCLLFLPLCFLFLSPLSGVFGFFFL